MKNEQIPIRVSSETKLLLKERAMSLHMSLSKYMIHAGLNHEIRVLQEGTEILSLLSAIYKRLNSLIIISTEEEKEIQQELKKIVCRAKENL